MNASTWRTRLARMLQNELNAERAKAAATKIDGGFGQLMMAALLATPRGPARAVEAARWARRAADTLDNVVVVIQPGMGPEEREEFVDAHTELMLAIAAERERAA